MHLSLAGGGARALVYASFFERLNETVEGRQLLLRTTSMSGVSAGAIIAAPLAMGVDPKRVCDAVAQGGLSDWLHWPRALLTVLGIKQSMYDGSVIYNRLYNVCKGKSVLKPISLAVTSDKLEQTSLRFTSKNSLASVLNCAVASASVPGLFSSREVQPVGKVFDGGAAKCTFAVDAILSAMRANTDIVLINCAPWPGFREPLLGTRNENLFSNVYDIYYEHNMEWLPKELGPNFRYKDGIFQYKKVTFVAPTKAQYAKSGGNKAAGDIFYTSNSSFTRKLQTEGRNMADLLMKSGIVRHI